MAKLEFELKHERIRFYTHESLKVICIFLWMKSDILGFDCFDWRVFVYFSLYE